MNGGTVPPDLVATGQAPDIVLLDREKKLIVLLELTVVFDSSLTSFKAAEDHKSARYGRRILDLKALGFKALKMPLEQRCKNVPTCQQFWLKKNPISGKIFAKFYAVLSRK